MLLVVPKLWCLFMNKNNSVYLHEKHDLFWSLWFRWKTPTMMYSEYRVDNRCMRYSLIFRLLPSIIANFLVPTKYFDCFRRYYSSSSKLFLPKRQFVCVVRLLLNASAKQRKGQESRQCSSAVPGKILSCSAFTKHHHEKNLKTVDI